MSQVRRHDAGTRVWTPLAGGWSALSVGAGVDGLGNTVGYWRPTQSQRRRAIRAQYGRSSARSRKPRTGICIMGARRRRLGSPFGFWKSQTPREAGDAS